MIIETITVLSTLLILVTAFWVLALKKCLDLEARIDDSIDVQADLRLKIAKLLIRLDAIKKAMKGDK